MRDTAAKIDKFHETGCQKAPKSPRERQLATEKRSESSKKFQLAAKSTGRRTAGSEFRNSGILVARPIRIANGSVTGEREYLVRMAQAEPLCTTIGALRFADSNTDWWFAIAGGHTASNAPDLFRPPKLSGAGPG